MEIRLLSLPAPDRRPPAVNEDLVLTGPDFVVVLDGATAPPGVDSGCRHTVAWLVSHLATQLAPPLLSHSSAPLTDLLADAISAVRAAHADTCDITNPDSPSSTVSMLRIQPGHVEHLVLADSPLVVRSPTGAITVHSDDRIDLLPETPWRPSAGSATSPAASGWRAPIPRRRTRRSRVRRIAPTSRWSP